MHWFGPGSCEHCDSAPDGFEHVGFARSAGAGEIRFRQAGHPDNERLDPEWPWQPVYVGAPHEHRTHR